MRIIHVLNHSQSCNGHVHAAVDLACAQAKLGHGVTIVSGGGDFDALLAENGVATHVIDQRRKPLVLLRAARELWRFARQARADVIHVHMMTSALIARPVALALRIPMIATVHNAFMKSSVLMGLGTRVIAVSEGVAKIMDTRGIPRRRIRVVLNGTIGAARTCAPIAPVALPRPSVLFVGGHHGRKGLPTLIEAFGVVKARVPDAHLCVAGDGPHRSHYEALARAAPYGDAIEFVGNVDNPRDYMAGTDVFVLPSLADPAPLVICEAREAGCAIVASDVDGIPELLDDGAAGVLVPPRDPARLGKAIADMLESPEMLAQWKARSHAGSQRLSIARVAEETLAVYREAGAR